MHLFKLWNVFVQIVKIYLLKFQNIFVQILKYICLKLKSLQKSLARRTCPLAAPLPPLTSLRRLGHNFRNILPRGRPRPKSTHTRNGPKPNICNILEWHADQKLTPRKKKQRLAHAINLDSHLFVDCRRCWWYYGHGLGVERNTVEILVLMLSWDGC